MGLVDDAPYSDVTYRVVGLAMAAHNDLGPGHREVVYHRALEAKLHEAGADFVSEPCTSVEMDDGTVVGLYYPDFVVEDSVIVELKAHPYPLTNDDVALLINFGRRRLEWKRLFPPKKIREHRREKWGKKLT